MITLKCIQVYQKYWYDENWWRRGGYDEDETEVAENDLFEIGFLMPKIHIMKAGLTSLEFNEKLIKEIEGRTDCKETMNALLNINKYTYVDRNYSYRLLMFFFNTDLTALGSVLVWYMHVGTGRDLSLRAYI